MTQAYQQLLETIAATRRSWRVMRLVEGVLALLAVAVGVLALVVMADVLFAFSVAGRLVLGLMMLAALVATGWTMLGRPLREVGSDDYFAALLEQHEPGLNNRVINALQLGRDVMAARVAAAYLTGVQTVVEAGRDAAEELRVFNAVQSPRLKWTAGGFVAAGVCWVLLAWLAGPAWSVSLQRVAMPWGDVKPYTFTQIAFTNIHEPTVRQLAGTTLDLEARTQGATVEEATLVVQSLKRSETLPIQRRRATPDAQGNLRFALEVPVGEYGMHLIAGDGTSETVRLIGDVPPRVVNMTAEVIWPTYTGKVPQQHDPFTGRLQVLADSDITIEIESNKPLAEFQPHVRQGDADLRSLIVPEKTEPLTPRASMMFQASKPAILSYSFTDTQGYTYRSPIAIRIDILEDIAPSLVVLQPGRDIRIMQGQSVSFEVAVSDDFGIADVAMIRVDPKEAQQGQATASDLTVHDNNLIHRFELPKESTSLKSITRRTTLDAKALNLKPGRSITYRFVASDHRTPTPNRTASPPYTITMLTEAQADAHMSQQLTSYARIVSLLIRQQNENLAQTRAGQPPPTLIQKQTRIREQTDELITLMHNQAFPGQSIIDQLTELSNQSMAQMILLWERARDGQAVVTWRADSEQTQQQIIAELQAILERLTRNENVRRLLKRIEKDEPGIGEQITATASNLAQDLDAFLADMRDLDEHHEKLSKLNRDRDVEGQDLRALNDVEHRLDRWKQWSKDSVDQILKLPDGFVKDSALADSVQKIFEEIEKKQAPATREIATPVEEGVKALAQEVAEDLEMWMVDTSDYQKWVMEDPMEGRFEVPESPLPENLQDIVGDLIEDAEDFDEEADDVTGGWGGNLQAGWDIADGPISTFAAVGKTGNQLPNSSEMSGRSGAGRRGRASGQMVGRESAAMEGRPTPARVTNEPYEASNVDATKQLDPRGATGGGRKTGSGQTGLQGGTPPDYVKELDRLVSKHAMIREKTEQVARQLDFAGRPSDRVDRATTLLQQAEQQLRDQRYQDAAKLRKLAISELRSHQAAVDQAVKIALQRATNLDPELREKVLDSSRDALPRGYEQIVGEYYKAISEEASP